MQRFALVNEEWVAEHHYATYHVDAADVAPVLAALVRNMYVETNTLRDTLRSAAIGLDDLIGEEAVEDLLAQVTIAAIPEAGTGSSRPWLDVARNEAAEVLAYLMAEDLYDVFVVSKRVRNKEISTLPSRGMDLIGIIKEPQLKLVCGEVKASSSHQSPPPVVANGLDSLHGQLTGLVGDHAKILRELNWSHKHAAIDDRILIGRAIILWAQRRLPTVAFALLVRPDGVCSQADFGIFREKPGDFRPSTIRFCLARIPGSLEDFAAQVYSAAREAQ